MQTLLHGHAIADPEPAREPVAELLADPGFAGRIVHTEVLPGRTASHADTLLPLAPSIENALRDVSIDRLYSHQAAAIDALRGGVSVALATGTASGKSLAYLVPALENALQGRTSLLLYPTKALARDQLRQVGQLRVPGVEAAVVDGDTSGPDRDRARRRSHVVVATPDVLHAWLLPGHRRWSCFLERLSLVVVDEVHSLRGIFGSHVAHVIRRLRRVASLYGADPVFLCTTATGGPALAPFVRRLTGLDAAVIAADGSPRAPQTVVCWNPPLIDPASGTRMSPLGETAELLARFVDSGRQTLAFTPSRKGAEIVTRIARERLVRTPPEAVLTYRAGYLPEERRDIEDGLASGAVRGVATTNALELGVDVGGADAVVLCGFPGTLSSFRQQLGRAGRRDRESVAVYVAGQDQLDQWYVSHPAALFAEATEQPVVNTGNPAIARPHLACAAYEHALRPAEPLLDAEMAVAAAPLVSAGLVRMRRNRLFWAGGRSPAWAVSIRTSDPATVTIVDSDLDRPIGTVDASRAPVFVHPGAVYMHQGDTWTVTALDLDGGIAWVERCPPDRYTQPRSETDIDVLSVDASKPVGCGGVHISVGGVRTTRRVVGYRVKSYDTNEQISTHRLDMPPRHLLTRAFWYTVPDALIEKLGIDPGRVPGTVHAAEHAGIGMLPRFAICDRWDIGGVSMAAHSGLDGAVWFIYDGCPGGAGIAEVGFACGIDHVVATLDVVRSCSCTNGCPSCIQSPKCGNWNEPLDKQGTIALLGSIAEG